MNMKKWIISVVTLALALGIAGAGTAFALTGDDGSDNPTVLDDTDTAWQISDGFPSYDEEILDFGDGIGDGTGGYVNRCVNDIRRRPSQPLIQWRFHPHTVHRDRRLRSTQGPSDA